MRTLDGRIFLTLKEYLAESGYDLPLDLMDWDVSTVDETVSMASCFVARYGRRYIFTTDVDEFADTLNETAKRVRYQFERMMNNVLHLEDEFIKDAFTTKSERKRPYNGTVSIENAPTEDAVVVRSSGASSGNIDKILRYQNEFQNMLSMALDQFSGLFISVVSDWGKEIE